MKHIWVKTEQKYGYKTIFRYNLKGQEDTLLISAGPYYTVYFDNQLVSYGPERTAAGYSRKREITIPAGTKEIEIIVLNYGVPSLDIDFFEPFFGAELYLNSKVISTTDDFKAYESSKYLTKSFKWSYQRGFGERFDLRNVKENELETFEVKSPIIIDGVGDTCSYNRHPLRLVKEQGFKGFDIVKVPQYIYKPEHPEFFAFDPQKDFLEVVNKGYICYEFESDIEISGLIKLNIDASSDDTKLFVVFDEYLDNGKWIYGRTSCNDLITIDVNKGKSSVTTSTAYSSKHLRVLSNKEVKVRPEIIMIQNDMIPESKNTNNKKLNVILEAARNTFMQNAVDIYTDCPGRERGGWLCDSYFTSIAERYFTGANKIEKCFLENFILGNYEEIEKGMLPMVFPGTDTTFIPNWAMWFVLELEQYYNNTGDQDLVDRAKQKVMDLAKYFEKFENEYSLLEDLHSWVFVEWSDAGTEDYVKGVSFPTNMLYSGMLKAIGNLYKENKYLDKANKVIDNINDLSFNGKLYIDNALRENDKLVPIKEHTSETCQYYALFFGLIDSPEYIHFAKNELGPLRKNQYPNIARSNSFIGNYLRFLWLKKLGEQERLEKEVIDYFYQMASYSGTLWEKNVPTASCNHGFASSIAAILDKDFRI